MSAIGYLQVKAYTSRAQIPIEDVAVSVVDSDGRLLGLRLTDKSGKTTPITIQVPDLANSQTPDTGKPAFLPVNIYARAEGYEQILIRNAQVFPDTVTLQELVLIPLSELPGSFRRTEVYEITPQNL